MINKSKIQFNPKEHLKNGLTEEDIIRIKQNFDIFDTQGRGWIDPKQIKQLLEAMGPQVTKTAIYQLINDFSSEGSGNIDFSHFIDLLSTKVPADSSRDYVMQVFALFDTQKTGYISVKNLRRIVFQLGQDLQAQDIQDMIMRADLDKDGLVSQQQFYIMVTNKFYA